MMEKYDKKKNIKMIDGHVSMELTTMAHHEKESNNRQQMRSKDIGIQTILTAITLDEEENFFRRRVETKDVSIQVELNATTPNDTDIQTASMQMYDDPHENPNAEETPDLEQVITSMEDFGNTIDDPIVRNRRVVENNNEESTPENTNTNNENDIEKDLGPIIEYAQVPLLPLFKACAPLEDILHNLSFYVQMALKETPEEPPNGLTIDESAAIRLYTIEWSSPHRSLYSMLNHTLKREDYEHLRPYFKYNHQYYQKTTSYYD